MTHTWCKYYCTCLYLGCVRMDDGVFMTVRLQDVSFQDQHNKSHVALMDQVENQSGGNET